MTSQIRNETEASTIKAGTGDWKVASTGRLESLPYMGGGGSCRRGEMCPEQGTRILA
jgi:hypothetical protein